MEKASEAFQEFLQKRNLHCTSQRVLIVEEFVQAKKHLSAEELYEIVRKKEKSIGQVTVFRTLKLMEEAGIAKPVNFGDRTVRFELNYGTEHHDHLICTVCSRVIEVLDVKLEKRKEKVCSKHNFLPVRHRLEIFGICGDCR